MWIEKYYNNKVSITPCLLPWQKQSKRLDTEDADFVYVKGSHDECQQCAHYIKENYKLDRTQRHRTAVDVDGRGSHSKCTWPSHSSRW